MISVLTGDREQAGLECFAPGGVLRFVHRVLKEI
jgi:hypothetical protein